jgi:regulatory protein
VANFPPDVYQAALRLLARREHSCFELRRKLQARDCTAESIEPVLQKLVEQNLLSDARFTEVYIRSRIAKGYGPVRIAAELTQRGIDEELIAEYLDPRAEDWLQQAHAVRQKRFGKKVSKDFAERAREMHFLQYRGFTIEQINKVFKEL